MPFQKTPVPRLPTRSPRHDGVRQSARVGDKVRIRTGVHAGARALICGLLEGRVRIRLLDGKRLSTTLRELTNYSAAARLAWKTMPKRAGRPPSPRPKTRVSLRIDSTTWEELGDLAAKGRIRSREQLVNTLLEAALKRLNRSTARATPAFLAMPPLTDQPESS